MSVMVMAWHHIAPARRQPVPGAADPGCASWRRLPGSGDRRVHPGPSGFARRELPPEISDQLCDLPVTKIILEAGHIPEVARCGSCDAVQDHLDQVVGRGAVQV